MAEREINPRAVDLPPLRRPKFLLSRHTAAVIVTLGYAGLVLGAKLFFSYLESTQGYDDRRDVQATMIVGTVMLFLCIRALLRIYRPVKLPAPPE